MTALPTIPPTMRSELRLSACFPFMRLPRELRDMIYDYALSYDGIQRTILSDAYGKSLSNATDYLQTPSILLVDKQTSSEAIDCLRKKELIFTCPVRCERYLILDHVISRTAFNNIRRIRLVMPEIQNLKHYCDCGEKVDEEEEGPAEMEIDLTSFLPLWVYLLEVLFKQIAGATLNTCMMETFCLQNGAEVLVIRGKKIFQLATKAVTILAEDYRDYEDEPDWLEIMNAILKEARALHGQK